MIRTQIQLTEEQAEAVRRIAARMNVSQAEIVRRSLDSFVMANGGRLSAERRKRALAAVGRFASDRNDVSARHDQYLADAFES